MRVVPAESGHSVTMIAACQQGEPVEIRGIVRTVTLHPRQESPRFEIDLDDGSGTLHVIWLGRRRILGVDPGRVLVIKGRVTCSDDRRTIFNPRYILQPVAR